MRINFKDKISVKRPFNHGRTPETEEQISRVFESDRGRIIHSAALRRLQHKTQVFPLERNASVRSRLTHSLEVQQAGRYIAREILLKLQKQAGLAHYGLENFARSFESLVEMACLLHDVGNPPFGHFGEAALKDWFKEHLVAGIPNFNIEDSSLTPLVSQVCTDLSNFEGNAQGIRLVQTILQLNLSYAQVACIMKYTAPAWWQGDKPQAYSTLMKKPGFYLSEKSYIEKLREETQLTEFQRFPLTYIMEAADDISYCIADLDDAVEKAIFNVDALYGYLVSEWGAVQANDLFSRTVEEAWTEARTKKRRSKGDQFFMSLRVSVQRELVKHAVQRFIDHLPDIFAGTFNHALLEDQGESGRLLAMFKKVARKYVFRHSEVEQLELQGYRVIRGLLDIYRPMMLLSYEHFNRLITDDELPGYPIETRLFHRLSDKHCKAYCHHLQQCKNLPRTELMLWERYYRYRLIQDYVSGMTDLYAWEEYRRLMAVDFV
ncbi:dGTPase [Rosenbergiella australiborealis]|uniref:Deoxyguanosinetriphosphate triphosphohydrolase n=1 Tax=Rosenbergiella australiborealis TaxID=1544696 RepID=A0ABS5T1Q5_9GAMM|nr:dGTPase [Rosenbergiella australiborealis]